MDAIPTPRRLTALVVGFVLVLSACGGSGDPSASFDGEECTYSGPESVGSGEVDVTFENNRFEDFHFWSHAGTNGPRPRNIVLRNNYVSDERIAKINFLFHMSFFSVHNLFQKMLRLL